MRSTGNASADAPHLHFAIFKLGPERQGWHNWQDSREQDTRLSLSRDYPVAPDKIWHAWTDPQALSQWFGSDQPGSATAAELDPQVMPVTHFDGRSK